MWSTAAVVEYHEVSLKSWEWMPRRPADFACTGGFFLGGGGLLGEQQRRDMTYREWNAFQ